MGWRSQAPSSTRPRALWQCSNDPKARVSRVLRRVLRDEASLGVARDADSELWIWGVAIGRGELGRGAGETPRFRAGVRRVEERHPRTFSGSGDRHDDASPTTGGAVFRRLWNEISSRAPIGCRRRPGRRSSADEIGIVPSCHAVPPEVKRQLTAGEAALRRRRSGDGTSARKSLFGEVRGRKPWPGRFPPGGTSRAPARTMGRGRTCGPEDPTTRRRSASLHFQKVGPVCRGHRRRRCRSWPGSGSCQQLMPA